MAWSYSYAAGAGLGSTPVVQDWAVAGLPVKDKVGTEYLGGAYSAWGRTHGGPGAFPYGNVDQVLARLGSGLWSLMMGDPIVFSSVNAIKEAILSDGVQVTPAILPKVGQDGGKSGPDAGSDPDAEVARDVAEFCRYNLDRLEEPLDKTLFELLDALPYGAELAEQVYEVADGGPYGGDLVLSALRVKPRGSYALVVDAFSRVVGAQGQVPYWANMGVGPERVPPGDVGMMVVIPRRKFALLQWNTTEGDPRGRSILRSAYTFWDIKQKLLPFYMRYLEQFATPSLVATLPENAQPREARDANGNIRPGVMVDPSKDMFDQLVVFQGGSVVVVPFGTTVAPLEVSENGESFAQAIDVCDRQMVTAIVQSPRATMESRHGSRADSQTGQDVMGLVIRRGKQAVAGMVRNDILRPLVREKFGDEIACRLTPSVSCGVGEHHADRAALMNAYANMSRGGLIDERIISQIYADLGIAPLPDGKFNPILLQGQAGPGGEPSTPGTPTRQVPGVGGQGSGKEKTPAAPPSKSPPARHPTPSP